MKITEMQKLLSAIRKKGDINILARDSNGLFEDIESVEVISQESKEDIARIITIEKDERTSCLSKFRFIEEKYP